MSDRGDKKVSKTKKSGKKRKIPELLTPPPNLQETQSGLPPIIPSAALLSQVQSKSQPHPQQSPLNPQPHPQQSPPNQQPQQNESNTQLPSPQSEPNSRLLSSQSGDNQTLGTSCSGVGIDNGENKILIEPDGDGFWPHKEVIAGIASCIKSKFEEDKPRWKAFPEDTREIWFKLFEGKFKWDPKFNVEIRSNFEKKGSGKLSQLLQKARIDGIKPSWIGETAWADLVQYWKSEDFKAKSEQNKKNRNSNAGASLHTGGCIPHRVLYRRMKAENGGKDPSFSDFYFRTHKTKKNKEWVHPKAQDAYES